MDLILEHFLPGLEKINLQEVANADL